MKVLNLVNKEASDIQFEVSSFPDGQSQVKVNTWGQWNNCENSGVQIKARLNNFKDLELIICATRSLRALGIKDIHLYTPYFLGSRSDRKFEVGSNNYLKDIICPIVNSLGFESVTVLDPHSDVLEACLNNFKKEDNCELVRWALTQINNKNGAQDTVFVSPDGGALKKIYKVADYVYFKGTIITCTKSRDSEGKLTKVGVPILDLKDITKDFIIIDDICDGGATFINIAERIKEVAGSLKCVPKIHLIVTHGIFSKGFDELSAYFDGIYCTNSYSDIGSTKQGDYITGNGLEIKQLKVF